ncbi:MAG: CinA family protein [Treponema sp.]|nr:CinA family protein [Treponema sp.]
MPSILTPALAYFGKAQLLAEEVVRSLAVRQKTIAAAESCTSGLASDFITRVPGASKVFWGAFVAYTTDAKIKQIGVSEELIREHGEVSRPVALAMAEGALEKSGASWTFSVTGFAGPGCGSADAPVGTVWIAISGRNEKAQDSFWSDAKMFSFSGSRNEVREAAAAAALETLLDRINRT